MWGKASHGSIPRRLATKFDILTNMKKGQVVAFISAPAVGTSFLTKQMACRHGAPAFFEGEDGIFTSSVLIVLNSEKDSKKRYEWLLERTRTMLERAHIIAKLGITTYVDGDVLLAEAWMNAEIGIYSPKVLKKWLLENSSLMADKVVVLIASEDKIKENLIKRGRISEQTDFIRERALRIGHACAKLGEKYKHVKILDRSNLEFTEINTLQMVDDFVDKIPAKQD